MYKLVINTILDRLVGWGGGDCASQARNTIQSFYVTVLGAVDKLLPNLLYSLKNPSQTQNTHTHTIT